MGTTQITGRQIVAPLSGSTTDLAVVTLAAAIAVQLDCELVLMRVVQPLLPPLFHPPAPESDRAALDAELIVRTDHAIREAHRELCEFERALEDVRVARLVLVSARPARRLVDWLRSRPVGLVVVASARRAAMRRLANTDLAAYLVRRKVAPILTVVCRIGEAECARRHKLASARGRPLRCRMTRWRSRARE